MFNVDPESPSPGAPPKTWRKPGPWAIKRFLVAVVIALASPASAQTGPDVIAGNLHEVASFGTDGSGRFAYAIGTVGCNVGDEEVPWSGGTANHPVIGQNLYRLKDDRFEQIGLSWVKHGITALQGYYCGSCTPSGSGAALGVGCSDPYSANLNGQQNRLGPRSVINPNTGSFPFPIGIPGWDLVVGRRLQVDEFDLDPDLNPGALYFAEAQYISAADALAGNGANNASYRQVLIADDANYSASPIGSTEVGVPALHAWAAADALVDLTQIDGPDGRFWIAHRVRDLGGGEWRYEYAVHNLNSHRAVQAVAITAPLATAVTQERFHGAPYHSGEPFSETPWEPVRTAAGVRFSTDTYADNPNANALRWGTLYNFGFTANAAPTDGSLELTLFRPGSGPAVLALAGVRVPQASATLAAEDFMRGDVNQDGAIDVGDALSTLGFTFQGFPVPDCLDAADFDDSGALDVADAVGVLSYLFAGGPGAAPPIGPCGPDPNVDDIPCSSFRCP